jgi:hypothetical protein
MMKDDMKLTHNRSDERRSRETSNGHGSVNGVPEVGHRATHHSQGGTTKHTHKKTAQHDGFNILCHCDRDLENCEDSISKKQWQSPSV